MRRVTLRGSGVETSALGFGCASLGSRVSANEALNCLSRAWDRGVTYFDVAPSYGRGEAEAILGRFLADRKDRAQVCTKVGLAPPPTSPLMRMALPLIRRTASIAAPLRRRLGNGVGARAAHVPLTPEMLNDSLERSLRRLGIERISVYCLHRVSPETLVRDDMLRMLEEILASGKVGVIGVDGDPETIAAMVQTGAPYALAQFALTLDPHSEALCAATRAKNMVTVCHSVLDLDGEVGALTLRSGKRAASNAGAPHEDLAALLLDRAFALNPDGVVLAAMFTPRQVARNVARAAGPVRAEAPTLVRALLDAA